ncbi:MAG: peptidoglycan -binding protein [Octadecabacter sp.]|jgi:chemotaxis protein MotB
MALSRRTGSRFQASIWPGFVDAMTGLLLVLMFVLTIFMVIQFVLRETITGQESRLSQLTAEVASLAQALGLEQDRSTQLAATVGSLTTSLAATSDEAERQAALVASLTQERDAQTLVLVEAQNRITGFEAQVAGLLSQRSDLRATVVGLEGARDELLSEQEALNLALATARDEIDAGAQAARLAAARREALEALTADLRAEAASDMTRISELEAGQLVDAAAAQALRDRLANADAELTVMTLALEEQRRAAEETLTLLAAAQSAGDNLDLRLAAALLAQSEAQAALVAETEIKADLNVRLLAALAGQDSSQSALAAAQAALAAAIAEGEAGQADLQDRLAEALLAGDDLQAQIAALRESGSADRASLEERLAEALAAVTAAEAATGAQMTQAERQAALLATANQALAEQEALSADSQREAALLNEQVRALRDQIGTLQTLLNLAEDEDVAAQVQIESLGAQLNTALARVAAEERRALVLERAERERLEAEAVRLIAEAQNLERYRSDFFGKLRDVLDGQDGVRIEGDRFVFSSEVLFQPGRASLSDEGRAEIAKVADILRAISNDIPAGIDWVIRVDGHTDNVPLSGLGEFANNWELSQARALSVVLYMTNFLGIPPERLAANGFGQYQPVDPADTDAARAQNRRIELKLTER